MIGRLGYMLFWFGLVMFAMGMGVDRLAPPETEVLLQSHAYLAAFNVVIMGIGVALYLDKGGNEK